MFAKIFETEVGQILIKKDMGDKGPEVKLYYEPPNLGVCEIAFNWESEPEKKAWENADEVFDKLNEEMAVNTVKTITNRLKLEG